jgi:Zn-dependent peptidase ImmA (M78 family)
MVKMVRDTTGRFALRPHYEPSELDQQCERILFSFLQARHGTIEFALSTDDLAVLIEQHADSLDMYADLSHYGGDVEGVTEFDADHAPKVSISENLANDRRRKNRLRSTLAHEFGHVHLHRHLWDEKLRPGQLFARDDPTNKAICKRDTIIDAPSYDWMEWQAGYVSGAILLPSSRARRLVGEYCAERGLHGDVPVWSHHGGVLIGMIKEAFEVSEEAARVRLLKLRLIRSTDRQPSLFGG